MRKAIGIAALAVLALAVLYGTAVAGSLTVTDETCMKAPPPAEGKAVREYIFRTSPYSKWQLWPGEERYKKGTRPHGAFVAVYLNEDAAQSVKDQNGMREGSMMVIENYSPGKLLTSVQVMYLLRDYNPAGGDWFWATFSPDGRKTLESGKLPSCLSCHAGRKNNDYVFTGKVKVM